LLLREVSDLAHIRSSGGTNIKLKGESGASFWSDRKWCSASERLRN
jgi:hypothetical protein